MTTIVLSTKEMAVCADRQVSIEGGAPAQARYRPKIEVLKRDDLECILASSGSVDAAYAFTHAFKDAFLQNKQVEIKKDLIKKMGAIVYYNDGTIHYYDGSLTPVEIDSPYFGVGSGSPFAIGALYNGAKLKEAVRIACLCDPFSGFGIQYVQFSKGKPGSRNNNRKGGKNV